MRGWNDFLKVHEKRQSDAAAEKNEARVIPSGCISGDRKFLNVIECTQEGIVMKPALVVSLDFSSLPQGA